MVASGVFEAYVPAVHVLHVVHTRSVVDVGSADEYLPDEHVAVLVVHTRLDDVVGAVLWCSSPAHASTAWHASPLSAAENVEPSVHCAHVRSAVVPPFTDWPLPTPHVCLSSHELWLV